VKPFSIPHRFSHLQIFWGFSSGFGSRRVPQIVSVPLTSHGNLFYIWSLYYKNPILPVFPLFMTISFAGSIPRRLKQASQQIPSHVVEGPTRKVRILIHRNSGSVFWTFFACQWFAFSSLQLRLSSGSRVTHEEGGAPCFFRFQQKFSNKSEKVRVGPFLSLGTHQQALF